MIRVRIIEYWNDFRQREYEEYFDGLRDLAEWIFRRMKADYSGRHGKRLLSFPECSTDDRISEIWFRPEYAAHAFLIKQIEDVNLGILFSDGTYTAGQKHCTREVRLWLAECRKRQENPVFNFAEDGAEASGRMPCLNLRQERS